MPDITKCTGEGCPLKEGCYRFTAPDTEFMQSYFAEAPVLNGECEYFWGKKQDSIMEQEFCSACGLEINHEDFEIGNAFVEKSPITFRKKKVHSFCHELEIELAKQMPSKKTGFENRYDEYLNTN